ncbi:MAG: hypothetical protein II966_08710 [Lachnospiraceae bacterium]|nr:hypothetical protein [Lachnospiraceae bacterium]
MNEDEQEGQGGEVNVTSVETSDGGAAQVDADQSASAEIYERKPEPKRLKTRPIPALVMLFGGSVVAVDVFIQQLDLKTSLLLILAGLVFFIIIGQVVKLLLDRIELQNPEAVNADGSVIEKGKSGERAETGDTDTDRTETENPG